MKDGRYCPYLTRERKNAKELPVTAIRPFVIGRRNWLFTDTPNGADASATLYSIIETAKAKGHEPYRYLRYVFTALPKASSPEQIAKLLPFNVAPQEIPDP